MFQFLPGRGSGELVFTNFKSRTHPHLPLAPLNTRSMIHQCTDSIHLDDAPRLRLIACSQKHPFHPEGHSLDADWMGLSAAERRGNSSGIKLNAREVSVDGRGRNERGEMTNWWNEKLPVRTYSKTTPWSLTHDYESYTQLLLRSAYAQRIETE